MKRLLRELVPAKWQVQTKYIANRFSGKLEPELELLQSILKRGDITIDIGANRGIYAYKLWKLGAFVNAFEPNPECARILRVWAAGKRSVVVHAVGISDKSGQAELRVPIDTSGIEHDASASLEPHGFFEMRCINVPLHTLDSFNFSGIRFIKIDVEGHERQVLLGAKLLLLNERPALLIEIEQRHSQGSVASVLEFLQCQGYRGFFLDNNLLAPLESFDFAKDQPIENVGKPGSRYINNFLFLHKGLIAAGSYKELFRVWA